MRTLAGRWRTLVRVGLPLLALAMLAGSSIHRKSATFDEAVLLASGAHFLATGDASLNAENPPLLKAFYALPTLFWPGLRPPSVPDHLRYSYSMAAAFAPANHFLFSQEKPLLLLFACRIMPLLLACCLGWLLYLAASRVWGPSSATVLLWVYALSPNILANAGLIVPDMGCALFVFLTTTALWRLLSDGGWRSVLFTGLALGGALLAKFTSLLLVPCLLIQAGLYLFLRRSGDTRSAVALRVGGGLAVALLVVNAFYGFHGTGSSLADISFLSPLMRRIQDLDFLRHIPIPLPLGYLRGFDIVAFNNQPGFPNIFLGTYYPNGGSWWYYYLVVPALKAPLPFLIALGASLWLSLRTGRSGDWAMAAVFLVPPAAIFLNFSLVAHRQLGLRYILPLWPFLILSLGILLEELGRSRPRSRVRPVAAALAAWFALGSLLTWPHYLTHFNLLAGGNRDGWRLLAVSDCDWGQDLPALAEWQRRNGYPPMHVLYYGTVPLAAYGVRAVPWGTRPVAPYLAISVTHYYILGKHPLVRFLRKYRAPIARLGNSIHVFEIDPAAAVAAK